jgi:polyhydroxybutyrate depolymerase
VASERNVSLGLLALTLICVLTAALCTGCGSSSQASSTRVQPVLGPFAQPVPGFHASRVTFKVADGLERDYLLYLPPGGAKRSPLVLVFHGAGSTAEQAARETDFVPVAAEDGFVVAFLQGYMDTWNEGAGNTPAHAAHVNDVEFTSAVLEQIERRYSIDRTRVAAAGFSNGALLTELLGCRLAGSLTLVSPLAGPLPVSVSPGCRPARPLSVLEMHGTDDQAIPYTGGRFHGIGGGTTVLSAPASAARWAALDHCGQERQKTEAAPAAPQPTVLATYSGCAEHVLVQLRTLEGAGHGWPADVGALIAVFLREHPRAP